MSAGFCRHLVGKPRRNVCVSVYAVDKLQFCLVSRYRKLGVRRQCRWHCWGELQRLLSNLNALVAVSKGMRPVKLCTHKILQLEVPVNRQVDLYSGRKLVVVVLLETVRSVVDGAGCCQGGDSSQWWQYFTSSRRWEIFPPSSRLHLMHRLRCLFYSRWLWGGGIPLPFYPLSPPFCPP